LAKNACVSVVFRAFPASGRLSGPSIRRADASVKVQKKKILPGHRLSGVSWRLFVDVQAPTNVVNDIA
jgi:hypothetical protein